MLSIVWMYSRLLRAVVCYERRANETEGLIREGQPLLV
jgi:hypothetical protein